jgi:DNA repair protein RadC
MKRKAKKRRLWKIRIKDLPLIDRPRERLIKHGPQALSTPELIAIILRNGWYKWNVLDLAKMLLKKYNLKRLSKASYWEILKIPGIGKAKACQIVACFELARRLASFREKEKITINSPKDVFRLVGPELQALTQEVVKVLSLDSRNRLISCDLIFKGSLDTNIIHPREIFKKALENFASSIILVHNHPSGDPEPSNLDIKITRRIVKAGEILGIKVQDHVIIGDGCYTSFKERKLI